jgi:hypothetical protein
MKVFRACGKPNGLEVQPSAATTNGGHFDGWRKFTA